MTDRLAAVGGTVAIESVPGHGTTVSGCLPAGEPAGERATALVH